MTEKSPDLKKQQAAIAVTAVRVGGFFIALAGVAILLELGPFADMALPGVVGIALIAVGIFDILVIPRLLEKALGTDKAM